VACTQGRLRAVLAPPLVALKMRRDTPTWSDADHWRASVSSGIDQPSTITPAREGGAPKPWAMSWLAPEESAGDGELVALAHTGRLASRICTRAEFRLAALAVAPRIEANTMPIASPLVVDSLARRPRAAAAARTPASRRSANDHNQWRTT
jgi:hypothetical protein